MDIAVVNIVPAGMSKQSFSDFPRHTCFHKSGCKCVAEIMEADAADARFPQSGAPGCFDGLDGVVFKCKDRSPVVFNLGKDAEHARRQGNFPSFPLRCFRARNEQEFPCGVHVFPLLVQDFAPPHSCIECGNEDAPQVHGGGSQERGFLGDGENRPPFLTLPLELDPRKRTGWKQPLLIHSPIENPPQDFHVAVHGGFRDDLGPVTCLPVLAHESLVNLLNRDFAKVRQQDFQAFDVMGPD